MNNDINLIRCELKNDIALKQLQRLINGLPIEYEMESTKKNDATISLKGIKRTTKKSVHTYNSIINGVKQQSICSVPIEIYAYKHPTQKPVCLMERLMALVSDEGNLILDPFLGGGTTAVAAINTNRNFIGFELQEEYYNVANQRIAEAQQIRDSKLFK